MLGWGGVGWGVACLLQLKSVLVQPGSSSRSPAPALRTPPGAAKEGADLVQPGSSNRSPAPAPRTPPGAAKEGADLVQQSSSTLNPRPPKPYINSKPSTLNIMPQTLNPEP